MRRRLTQLFCVLAITLFAASIARAEYRVYQLGVTYVPGEKEVVVLSTLDHLQYVSYYQITSNQATRLIDHWMCPGDTSSFKTYCANPKTLNPGSETQTPAPPSTPVL